MYDTYNNAGPSFPLIISAISFEIVMLPGMMFNLFLVYVTIKNKFGFMKNMHKNILTVKQINNVENKIELQFIIIYNSIVIKQVHRTLRSNTNYLLMITSLFEFLHQTWSFTFFVVAISGINFVTYWTCMSLEYPAVFGVAAAQVGMSATAIDRLFSIAFPFW